MLINFQEQYLYGYAEATLSLLLISPNNTLEHKPPWLWLWSFKIIGFVGMDMVIKKSTYLCLYLYMHLLPDSFSAGFVSNSKFLTLK